jgi:hypothetical protein
MVCQARRLFRKPTSRAVHHWAVENALRASLRFSVAGTKKTTIRPVGYQAGDQTFQLVDREHRNRLVLTWTGIAIALRHSDVELLDAARISPSR